MSWQEFAIWGQFFIILVVSGILLASYWKQSFIMQKIEMENKFKMEQLARIEALTTKLEEENIQNSAQLTRIEQHTTEQFAALRAKTDETDKVVQQVVENQPGLSEALDPSSDEPC